jgi:hypothetical protein
MFVMMLEHTLPNYRPTRVIKYGPKNSQILVGTQNTVYKGKNLHIHTNKKNHILENHNGKYVFPPLIKISKNQDKKQSHNCMTKNGNLIHLSPCALGVKLKQNLMCTLN